MGAFQVDLDEPIGPAELKAVIMAIQAYLRTIEPGGGGGTGGGIPEAPIDTNTYGRSSLTWKPVLTSISTDGVTITGTGTPGSPLRVTDKDVSIAGPYATKADIPTPYDPSMIYLVGTSPPYMQSIVNESGVLVDIGPAEADLTDYYKKAEVDASQAAQDAIISSNASTVQGIITEQATQNSRLSSLETSQISEPPNDGKKYARMYNGSTYVWERVYDVQTPFIQAYQSSPSVTLPVVPHVITEIWVMQTTANPYYLTTGDYTVNGAVITLTNPAFESGMTIKIVYTA